MSRSHLALAFLMSLVFGAGWVFGKTATSHFSPILVAMFRFGFAGILLVILCGWPKVPLWQLWFASACALGIPYSFSYIGLSQLNVSVTVLLVQLEAPILIVLSAVLLREVPDRSAIAGVVLAVAGVVFVVGAPAAEHQHFAIMMVMVSMFIWALGQIQVRRFGLNDGGLKLLGALCLLAAPQLLVLSLIFENGQAAAVRQASALVWMQVLYLGLGMTVIGQGIWFHLVARHPLHDVAPFLLLVPLFSIAAGVAFLQETLSGTTIVGGILIILGVALAALGAPSSIKLDRSS
ncbi:DMT family transporter [Roseobacter weihaiensis]|uniref:DMT family transporter n=1 Tax=Roseobacter weihaiensis TaxID=2763262 RepID=UPI001D09F64F|nr:DMT family transporter [Roseobacter sp. H9]